eukprot:snap_masked-scaffold_26-processed-gene-3.28-mRNA-1 protein AED:1.00 eAED:1.00 QI:0/0/0/0/1/1/3/0/93
MEKQKKRKLRTDFLLSDLDSQEHRDEGTNYTKQEIGEISKQARNKKRMLKEAETPRFVAGQVSTVTLDKSIIESIKQVRLPTERPQDYRKLPS